MLKNGDLCRALDFNSREVNSLSEGSFRWEIKKFEI